MNNNIDSTNNNFNFFDEYDFLNFSFRQIPNFKKGLEFGGTNGIGFEKDSEKYNKLIEEIRNTKTLQTQKILKGNPSHIKLNENTLHHFKYTLCIDFIEYLSGFTETKEAIYNAIQLSKDFIYISQDNFDSDVILFKRGFKTNYSNWTAYTNHLTSNIYFNMLFEFYKLGIIEDYIIFYSEPIQDSNNKYIQPLNGSTDQDEYNADLHPYKRTDIKFHNVFHKLNILIAVKGFKNIDETYNKIEGEKNILYDSRNGLYEKDMEDFVEPKKEPKKGIFSKVNDFLGSDI